MRRLASKAVSIDTHICDEPKPEGVCYVEHEKWRYGVPFKLLIRLNVELRTQANGRSGTAMIVRGLSMSRPGARTCIHTSSLGGGASLGLEPAQRYAAYSTVERIGGVPCLLRVSPLVLREG
jgi:hypothetical protein